MPKPSLILNPAQAEAIYSATCAINNVSATAFGTTIPQGKGVIRIIWSEAGGMQIGAHEGEDRYEHYDTQAAFAASYGLNADALASEGAES